MKRGLKLFLILLLLALIGGGVYYYLNPKKALVVIFPEIEEIQRVHIKLLKDTALIALDIKIENKSFFKLNVDSLSYQISLDTTELFNKQQYLNIVLEPGEHDTMTLPLALPFRRLSRQIKTLQGQDSAEIDVKLRVVYKTIFGETALPVARKIKIAVPHPPKIELVKTEFMSRDKRTIFVDAHIKVTNHGNIDLKLSKINYKMVAEDLFTVEDKYPRSVVVKPNSHEIFVLPVKVEVHRLFKTAFKVLTNTDKVAYTLKVTAVIESHKMEGESTPVDLEKTGILELKK